jgi:putative flippase GtrA
VKKKSFSIKTFFDSQMVRWWIVGLFFTGLNLPILGVLKEVVGLSELVSLILASEIGTLLRYFANDYWVFGYPRPSFKRCWEYHIANLSSFIVWVVCSNYIFLPLLNTLFPNNIVGDNVNLNLYIATILATGVSVGWSMVTNFLWIWRKKEKKPLESTNLGDDHN